MNKPTSLKWSAALTSVRVWPASLKVLAMVTSVLKESEQTCNLLPWRCWFANELCQKLNLKLPGGQADEHEFMAWFASDYLTKNNVVAILNCLVATAGKEVISNLGDHCFPKSNDRGGSSFVRRSYTCFQDCFQSKKS